jgi:hypothetical protein
MAGKARWRRAGHIARRRCGGVGQARFRGASAQ